MSSYTLIVSLHVIVAILGLGPLMALALLTRRPPLSTGTLRPLPPEPALRAFLRVLRTSQACLALMLATGAILVAMTHGAFGRQLWMIVSVVLFVALGAGTGLAQSCLKQALKPGAAIVHVERAHKLLVLMCAIVGAVAWLMQTKPF
jgi:hypothetical protein